MISKRRAFTAPLLVCVAAAVAITPFIHAQETTDTTRHAEQQPQSVGTEAEENHAESDDEVPFSPILLELAVIIGVAMLGRWLAESVRQSAVLGELLIGVVIELPG